MSLLNKEKRSMIFAVLVIATVTTKQTVASQTRAQNSFLSQNGHTSVFQQLTQQNNGAQKHAQLRYPYWQQSIHQNKFPLSNPSEQLPQQNQKVVIQELHIRGRIVQRFAETKVACQIYNPSSSDRSVKVSNCC